MSSDALLWLLSLTEAGLFFAGGVLFSLYRTTRAGQVGIVGDDSLARPRARFDERHEFRAELAETPVSGDQLRKILEHETRHGGVAGAVIADQLGLVVAGEGELCEVLAAYGAVLAGVGDKTREVLPFQRVRKVVVQDDCEMTLTVRPIVSADEQFALVTLSCGQPGASARPPSER